MPVYNQSRSGIIQVIFIAVFLIIITQLLHLQIFSSEYKIQAVNNAIYRKVVYPERGVILDRKNHPILQNTTMYDLLFTPNEIKGTDTASLCMLLGIDSAEFRKKVIGAIIKNTSYKPSVFEPLLSTELYARLNENMYKFPGFILAERPVRTYPYAAAGNVLGYLAEVDTGFLRRHKEEGYEMGDYTGMTGLERSYEKVLMGQRGVQRFIRDNRSRIQGPYDNGRFDTAAEAGKNLHLSLDIELQKLGEKLMANKVGSIVAIDPSTGGILCMVSSPNYDPNELTGSDRRKHFSQMYRDPRLPLINRAVSSTYSPGSTFKTVVGIVGLTEGVIDEKATIYCSGGFYGCGRRLGCLDVGTFNFRSAIAHSDNSYFATVFKRIIDQDKYGSPDSALKVFNQYAYSFGLGKALGIDIPSEKRGNIPTPTYYQKIFGRRWLSCNIISNSIGQGEVSVTLSQLANVMALIANKGWYYTPHFVDSIEGGDPLGVLDSFKVKHHTLSNIPDSVFEAVHDGMQGVMDYGTGAGARVPGVIVCGKTGTVENYFRGVQQKDHAFFGAFAPRDKPRIAIAVMCENAGFGATSAAPIASLMIEKYLKDSITEPNRKAEVERVSKLNLIPKLMRQAIDSINHLRDSLSQLSAKNLKEIKDTIGLEEQPVIEIKRPAKSPDTTGHAPIDSSKKTAGISPAILLPEEKKIKKYKTINT